MHSLSTFALIFSKAKGLRHQSSSWCARLSRAPTTTPYPTLPLPPCYGLGPWGFVGVALAYFPLPFASLGKSPVFTMWDSNEMV